MRRYKLKKEVRKALITILLIAIGFGIYVGVGYTGALAQESGFYECLTVLGWTWLIFIQSFLLAMIWDI